MFASFKSKIARLGLVGLMGLTVVTATAVQPASAAEIKPNAKYQVAANYAFSQVGKYVYDCSTLSQNAWKAAGISLPRTAQAQYNSLQHIWVAYDHLITGDLVFMGPGPSSVKHVVIYYGAGWFVWGGGSGNIVKKVNLGTNLTPAKVAKYFNSSWTWSEGGRPGGHW